MSIDIFTGVPGSGKSLHAARECRYCLDRKYPRPVLANFRLSPDARVMHPEAFTYIANEDMSAGKIIDLPEPGTPVKMSILIRCNPRSN